MTPEVVTYLLRDLDPPARPLEDYTLAVANGGVVIVYWADRLGPRPTDADLEAVAASPEYQEWHRTHGSDPAATLAREASEVAGRLGALELGVKSGLLVAHAGTMADRACLAQLAAAVARIEAHLGLTPSVIEVPPLLTVDECEGLRRQAVAGLLGLPPMAREGE